MLAHNFLYRTAYAHRARSALSKQCINTLCISCSMEEIRRNYELTPYSLQLYSRGVKKGSDFESYDLGVHPRDTP